MSNRYLGIRVPIESLLKEHALSLPNLVAHASRIRDRYFPARAEVVS